ETVEWLVGVERGDDVVAVTPGVRADLVELVSVALGEAGQVEPVPAPALAIVWRGEQAVHDLFPGILQVIVQEVVARIGSRWQPYQVQAHAPQQLFTGGRWGGLEASRFQACENERVNGVLRPRPVEHGRHRGTDWRFPRPVDLLRRWN